MIIVMAVLTGKCNNLCCQSSKCVFSRITSRYIEDKYNIHLDEPKYSSCHMEEIKQHYPSAGISHTEDNENLGVIKSEDSHTYVLPPFLH